MQRRAPCPHARDRASTSRGRPTTATQPCSFDSICRASSRASRRAVTRCPSSSSESSRNSRIAGTSSVALFRPCAASAATSCECRSRVKAADFVLVHGSANGGRRSRSPHRTDRRNMPGSPRARRAKENASRATSIHHHPTRSSRRGACYQGSHMAACRISLCTSARGRAAATADDLARISRPPSPGSGVDLQPRPGHSRTGTPRRRRDGQDRQQQSSSECSTGFLTRPRGSRVGSNPGLGGRGGPQGRAPGRALPLRRRRSVRVWRRAPGLGGARRDRRELLTGMTQPGRGV